MDKNYTILQWKVCVKWTSTFREKTDNVGALAKFHQKENTPVLFFYENYFEPPFKLLWEYFYHLCAKK